ncbi:hypothetical protein DFQ28_003786 [Apophysomyces sp. BC1034]|nr:hypothetical protein DFQ28_003786 [Apophysomyces sp. BC1034]
MVGAPPSAMAGISRSGADRSGFPSSRSFGLSTWQCHLSRSAHRRTSLKKFTALALCVAVTLSLAFIPAHGAKLQLDVTGNIQRTNVAGAHVYRFTEQELLSMPRAQFTTATNWTPSSQFSGVLLSHVLSKVGAKGTTLRVSAYDGYVSYAIPISDAKQYGVLLAYRMNGKKLTLKDYGPLFLVYPRDKFPDELNRSDVAGRFVWQVKSLEGISVGVVLALVLSAWGYTALQWTSQETLSVYKLAGPQENYYWGPAQFKFSVARLENMLLRYASGDSVELSEIKDAHAILESKFSLISNPSDTTLVKLSVPDYAEAVSEIRHCLGTIEPLISNLRSDDRSTARVIADTMRTLDESTLRLAQGIGEAENKRRDIALEDFRHKRKALWATSTVAASFTTALLVALAMTTYSGMRTTRRERALRIAEQSATAAAYKSLQAKNAFLGAIGHEIRTPLQTLSAGLSNLADTQLSARNMCTVLRMEQAAEQIDVQLRDLADYARLDAGKLKLRIELVDLADIVQQAAAQMQPMASRKGLSLRVDAKGVQWLVHSDRRRILQILLNLVDNAIKYSTQGEVVIRAAQHIASSQCVTRIAVTDSGIGIPEAAKERLFEPFVQLDESNARSHTGIGMGLTIVDGLVRRLGGDITVTSAVGVGSTFEVTFRAPADTLIPRPAVTGQGQHVSPRATLSGKQSLVVDDQPEVREALVAIMRTLGFTVTSVDSAWEARVMLNHREVDVVLIDLQIPDEDGVSLARWIREAGGPDAKLVGISASAPERLSESELAMFDDFLMKPIRIEALSAALEKIVEKVALVTGSSKRAGKIIIEHLAKNGYGVAVHAHTSRGEAETSASELRDAGYDALAVSGDLQDSAQIDNVVHKVFARFGRLDLLVNNAAVFWQDDFVDFSVEALNRAWAVNCRAPILLARAFYERAKALGVTGTVINIVDQKVKGNFHRDHFSYTVGKTAIGNLTQMLAISAAPVLRINAIFPGLMLPSDNQSDADFSYAAHKSNLLGRVAGPADVAAAVLLLSSPAYNGTDFIVDSGQNLIPVQQDVIYLHRAPEV